MFIGVMFSKKDKKFKDKELILIIFVFNNGYN